MVLPPLPTLSPLSPPVLGIVVVYRSAIDLFSCDDFMRKLALELVQIYSLQTANSCSIAHPLLVQPAAACHYP